MSHMQPEITNKCDWLEVESARYGTTYVEAHFVPSWSIPADVEVLGEFINEDLLRKIIQYTEILTPGAVNSITLIRGYGARLSAPGYLDCTDWDVFKTLKEAREYIRDLEDDQLEDDQLEDDQEET